MSDDWDFIDSWLDDVLNSQHLKTSSSESASFSPIDPPPSPPPSIWPKRPSCTPPSASKHPSLKRKRCACLNSYNCDIMPSPRKRTRTKDDQLSTTTTTSVLSDTQPPSTAHPRSPPLAKAKTTSSVHELRETYLFASPPLKFTTSIDGNTPQSVVNMIHGLPLHGVGVIPGSLKVIISISTNTCFAAGGDRHIGNYQSNPTF